MTRGTGGAHRKEAKGRLRGKSPVSSSGPQQRGRHAFLPAAHGQGGEHGRAPWDPDGRGRVHRQVVPHPKGASFPTSVLPAAGMDTSIGGIARRVGLLLLVMVVAGVAMFYIGLDYLFPKM